MEIKKRLNVLEEEIKEIKKYIEITEGSSESFDEIIKRLDKWKEEKPSNARTNDGLNKTIF